jgi:hypothetical protein
MNYPRFAAVAPILLILPLSAAAMPARGVACDCCGTLYAWHRTWHGPNALDTPLRGYEIPRMPGRCDQAGYANFGGYTGTCGCAVTSTLTTSGGYQAPCWGSCSPHVGIACDPTRFERLGQIPNDIELAVGAPASAPSR